MYWAGGTAIAAESPLYQDIHLLEAGAGGLKFLFSPTGWSVDTAYGGRSVVTFRGAQWSTTPGAPAIPQRSVLVAVPPEGEVMVSGVPSGWRRAASQPPALRGRIGAGAAGDGGAQAAPPVLRWDGPFWSRDLRLVRIWLAPVRVTGDGQSATDAMEVDVRWTGDAEGTSSPANTLFDPVYRGTILNHEQARTMHARPARAPIDNPFEVASEWYRVTVSADGPHVITTAQLGAAGFPVASVDPREIRMYYAGGRPLPVKNSDPRPTLAEIPIEITGEGDGRLDGGDAIYFYGQAANRWQNDDSEAVYVTNAYTREVVFWLTPSASGGLSPLRIGSRTSPPGADPANTLGIGRVVAEQNLILDTEADDYFNWYWQKTRSMSVLFNLPAARTGPGRIATTSKPALGPANAVVNVNGSAATFLSNAGRRSEFQSTAWLPTTTVQLAYQISGDAWIDRVEAIYTLDLDAAHVRDVWLPAASGNHARIANMPAGALVWDITLPDSPVVMQGTLSGNQLAFDPGAALQERRFRIWIRGEARPVDAIAPATPGRLRASPSEADMLIVAPPSLAGPLVAYADYRSVQSGVSVEQVDVQDVYADFGFGQFDPVAIRDFFKYTYETSARRPSAALLVGDGNYDFLNHTGTGTLNAMPPFIVEPTLDRTAGDQMYVSFGRLGTLDMDTSRVTEGDRGWDMMIARWPVRDAFETQTVIDKVRGYEESPEFGTWRNRVVMVADDEFGQPPSNREIFHTEQAEEIATHIPETYDRQKIYLVEYPRTASGQKPGAQQAILDAWNEGMVLVDYVGHGSPNVWAHEDVFRRTRDLPRLFNGERLPLVYTASCSIGLFDDPQAQGMGEELLRRAAGGAIAIISATRLVFSQPNVDLNEAVLDFLMAPVPMTFGQALFAGLIARQYEFPGGPVPLENDRKHILMGDPLVHLAHAELRVQFDSAAVPDSLVALRPVRLTGSVVDSAGQPVDLAGTFELSVHDAPRARQYEVGARTVYYDLEGRPIFEGTFPSDSAGFDLSFYVPKDVSYGSDGARIVMYAQGGGTDALGIEAPIPVAVAGDSTDDTEGPVWVLKINGEIPSGRVRVGPADVWEARITDPLGINIGGGGHGISVMVDGDEFGRRDITDRFAYDVGSISTGTVQFDLPDLAPGDHEIQLMAWDNANNPSILAVPVEASGDVEYAIRDLLVYPNPFDPDVEAANLTYELTFPPERVRLSVFTVAGNRVRVFDEAGAHIGFNYATRWDGTDDVGDRVAAGVYILAVEAEAAGEKVKEFTKIVLIRSD